MAEGRNGGHQDDDRKERRDRRTEAIDRIRKREGAEREAKAQEATRRRADAKERDAKEAEDQRRKAAIQRSRMQMGIEAQSRGKRGREREG